MKGLIQQIEQCRNLIAEAEKLSKGIKSETTKMSRDLSQLTNETQSLNKERK